MIRVLHINKFAYRRGGAEVYMIETALEQQRRGFDVAIAGYFSNTSMDRRDADLSEGTLRFSMDATDYHNISGWSRFRAARDVVWSTSAASTVSCILKEFRPDVVHLHNYAHQLSSSIVKELNDSAVHVVHTAHDYKLVCPAYVGSVDGKDCFDCADRISTKLLRRRCHHHDLTWSSLVGVEALFVRQSGLVPKQIIAPSRYMAESLNASWLRGRSQIHLLRNPVRPSGVAWRGADNYLLYVGRLSREKGVLALIQACAAAGLRLMLAGDGPIRYAAEGLARDVGLKGGFLGHVEADRLAELRRDCTAQIVSSEWPENAPLAALEAAADGVPLVLSNRGGLPELREIGAKAAIVDDFGQASLRGALTDLDRGVPCDQARFRSETSWDSHAAGLARIYEIVEG